MKVLTYVSKEIEVNITGEDAVHAILEGSEDCTPKELVWMACNNFLVVMRALPDSSIAQQPPEVRKIIADELEKLLARFRA